MALVAIRFDRSWPQANQRNRPDDTALAAGQAILADQPETNAAVLATFLQAQSLSYLTEIWGNRPDVGPVSSDEARGLLASGERPLYVTVDAAPIIWQEVSPEAHLSSAGAALIAVAAKPATELPAGIQQLDLTAGDGLTLAGYEQISEPGAVDDKPWQVRLIWRADDAIATIGASLCAPRWPANSYLGQKVASYWLIGSTPCTVPTPPAAGSPVRWSPTIISSRCYRVRRPTGFRS